MVCIRIIIIIIPLILWLIFQKGFSHTPTNQQNFVCNCLHKHNKNVELRHHHDSSSWKTTIFNLFWMAKKISVCDKTGLTLPITRNSVSHILHFPSHSTTMNHTHNRFKYMERKSFFKKLITMFSYELSTWKLLSYTHSYENIPTT